MPFQKSVAGFSQSSVFVLLCLCLCSSAATGQQIELNLSSPSSVYAPGESFVMELSLENPAGETIRGLQHAIAWDSGSLQLLSVDLPGSLSGSPDPEILVWNAPEPAGVGGDQGCASWWDGTAQEAFSLGLILSENLSATTTPLAQLEFRVVGNAPNGVVQLSTPEPDLTCGWIGSIVTDQNGVILPTLSGTLDLEISDVLRPTDLACGEVSETVFLTWQEPVDYSQIQIRRDGLLIAEIAGGLGYFEDAGALIGTERSYSLRGIVSGVTSPAVSCVVSIDGELETPTGLSCTQNANTVLLTWENPLPYEQVDVLRQGNLIGSLNSLETSFVDSAPIPGITLDYVLRSSLAGNTADSESCEIFLPIPDVLFIRGDVDSDGELNLVDPVTLLQYLFVFGDMPCASAADFNDDASLDLSDAVNLLAFLFTGGSEPAAPFPLAGLDPTPDSLGCDTGCSDATCGAGFPGDECTSAVTVTLGDNNFDTTLMTDSTDPFDDSGCESTSLGQMYADIWFDFTAPTSGNATFSLCSDEVVFDSDMVIYSGSCGQLLQQACNGDGVDAQGNPCPLLTSRISDIPVSEGDHFFIRVGGFDSLTQSELGPGVLTITID